MKPDEMLDETEEEIEPEAETEAEPALDEAADEAAPAKQAPPQSAIIERITTAAVKALYSSQEIVQGVLKHIASAKRPEIGIARAALMILEQIKQKIQGADPALAAGAIPELVAEICRIALAAKLIKADKVIVKRATEIIVQELRRPQMGGQSQQQQAPQPQPQAAPAPPGGGMIDAEMGA